MVSAAHLAPPPPRTLADRVSAALALGRQITELYMAVSERGDAEPGARRPHHRRHLNHPPPPAATAGLGPLDEAGLFQLRLDAVQAVLHRISGVAADAGLVMPTADDLIAASPSLAGQAGCQTVTALHQRLIEVLSASELPMGTAYELGTALATLCESTCQNAHEFADAISMGRIDRIRDLINRLRSMLPPHSAHAVGGALNNWEDWLAAGKMGDRQIQWERDGPQIAQALTAQSNEWFSLLTGQKAAVDLLSVDDYVNAGEALLRRYRKLGSRFLAQWWPYLMGGMAAAGVMVFLFLHYGHGDTKGFGTIATLLAAVGVTAKTASSTLTKTASSVEDSLWQSELDNAVMYAATKLPEGMNPVVMPMTRPLQLKQRMAADSARKARRNAIAGRAANRAATASTGTTPPQPDPRPTPLPSPAATAPPTEGR